MRTASLHKLRKSLDASLRGESRSVSKLAQQYDDFILDYDRVPDEAWNVLSTVFREPAILKQRGLEDFLLELNVDQAKYSPQQLRDLLTILESSVGKMEHDIARHAAGDFIARAYPQDLALKTFKKLAGSSSRERHVALVGLDVLRHHADEAMMPAINDLVRVLLDSK